MARLNLDAGVRPFNESGYEILLSINSDVETATLFSEALRL